MQNPNPVNLTTTAEIRRLGWIAEARDEDGHLASTQAWLDAAPTNENFRMLGEFIAEYETNRTVTVVTDLLAEKLKT
ncbi:hypothetical protein NBRC116598_20990 [Pseudophaeobacter arcticus]|uniref:Uncharacterized protein n=1 Tax=Pseudophaeobacter arcticus TaxID=385492 RepID=A0ABQ0ALC1_9RHOB